MGLNELGCVAAKYWQEIPEHYPFVELDEWIVMPNHVHGIVGINNNPSVETIHELSLRNPKQRRKMLIPKIIGRFKMQSAKHINIQQNTEGYSVWQKNFTTISSEMKRD